MLHQGCTWLVQVYELESSMRPIAKMLPGVVSIRRGEQEPHQLWPPVPKFRHRFGGRRGGGGGGPRAPAALEDWSSSSGDDDGDDDTTGGGAGIGDEGVGEPVGMPEGMLDDGEESEELEDDVGQERRLQERNEFFQSLCAEMDEIFADGGDETLRAAGSDGDERGGESQHPAAAASSEGDFYY